MYKARKKVERTSTCNLWVLLEMKSPMAGVTTFMHTDNINVQTDNHSKKI